LRIFGVVPAAYRQHGRLDALQVARDIARLPELVVGVMLDGRGQVGALAVVQRAQDVRHGLVPQEEIVGIGGAVVEAVATLRSRGRVFLLDEVGVEAEISS
jgi:hypothetical protein